MMIARESLRLGALAIAAIWLFPASGHHSHGNYQMTEYTHLAGMVKELHWMSPHTWIYLEVPNSDGDHILWALEGGSPNSLLRKGWSPDSVEPGDHISVRCHQMRDGSNGCLLGFVTPPGGEEKEWD
ncbi:MAG: DUF6152 family protein [Pseudomonadota bacterium]|jgi:hypothetical protein|nr:DUF6152 family protein [Pseudomonadota bacterium]